MYVLYRKVAEVPLEGTYAPQDGVVLVAERAKAVGLPCAGVLTAAVAVATVAA